MHALSNFPVLILFSAFLLPLLSSPVFSLRMPPLRQFQTGTFTPPACDDSVEFQTLLKNTSLCDSPSLILIDRLDSTNMFVRCQNSLIRLQTTTTAANDTTSSSSGSATIGQYAQQIFSRPALVAQLTNDVGDMLFADSSMFFLIDRLMLSPLQTFTSPSAVEVLCMVVDEPILARNAGLSLKNQQGGFVYFIGVSTSAPADQVVMRMQINHQNPNQSTFEPLLPTDYTNKLSPQSLHIQPKIHVLHIVSSTLVLEYDLLSNATRTLFNLSSANPLPSATISAVVMDDSIGFGSSLDVVFISLAYVEAPIAPMIIRVFRKTLSWDVLATTATCRQAALVALTFSSIDRTLFISCTGFAAAASFNGSINDPDTTLNVKPITNSFKCGPTYVARVANPVAQLVIACQQSSSLITTIGASLWTTISYSTCETPKIISSQFDEFGREVVLHSCGYDTQSPTVTVDGIPERLASLCGRASDFFHRSGTSQIFARCTPDRGNPYIASVNTDNSNLQRLFECPTNVSMSNQQLRDSSGIISTQTIISNNSTLLVVCDTHDLWSLPLDLHPSNPTLLWSIPIPGYVISSILASSHFAFVSVTQPGRMYYYAINLVSGAVNTIEGGYMFVDEPNDALWTTQCTGDYFSDDTQCYLYRQQPIGDFTPSATELFVNVSSAFRAWTVDSETNLVAVVLNNAQLMTTSAYNITGDVALRTARVIPVMPTCISEQPFAPFQQIAVHHKYGLLLLECESQSSPNWVITGLPIQELLNPNATAHWLPVLRTTSDCAQLQGSFVMSAQENGMYLTCDTSTHLSLNFQCANGQQWYLGQCGGCVTGWSKKAFDTESNSLVIPQCTQCAPGSIAVAPGSFSCLPCSIGTYHDSLLGEVCRPCPTGKYQNATGSIECIPCESGTYAPSQGSVSCSTCPLGSLPDLLAVTCVACPKDSYAPNTTSSQCVSCEGAHQAGLVCSNGLASVKAGYFGFSVSESDGSIVLPSDGTGVFHSASCPDSFCPGSPLQLTNSNVSSAEANSCPADDPQIGPIHHCCWPRLNSPTNILCAECVDGHIAWSSRCVSCTSVNGGLISLVLMFSIALIAWLYSNAADTLGGSHSQTNTSGHIAILLYFVQICSLQLGRASDWLNWIHWSNLGASSTSGCIAPLDAYQQTAMNLAVPLLLTGIMLLIATLHGLCARCTRKSVVDAELDVHRSSDSSPSSLDPSYQQNDLQHPFITIHSESREKLSDAVDAADVEALDANGINSDSVSLSSAVPSSASNDSFAFWSPLSGCYSSSAWYWNAFVLTRRVSFSACAVFLANSAGSRYPVFTLMHFFAFLIHQHAAPYRQPILNFIDGWSHSVLLVVSVLLSLQSPPYPAWFEALIVLSVTISILGMVGWIARIKIAQLFKVKTKTDSESLQSQSESKCVRLILAFFTPAPFSAHRYFRTFLLILLFCYTSVTSTVFSFLHCVDVASNVRLVFDTPTMDCRSDRYHTYRVWVILVLVVYTIGFPVASLVLLAWHRRAKS